MKNLSSLATTNSGKSSDHLLILTTSGGGGHLQAAAAIKEELLDKNPNALIVEKNIVQIAAGKLFGKFMIEGIWNSAQKKGSVNALNLCAVSIPLFDMLFGPSIFFQIFNTLKKEKIDHVIDTQPMTTFATTSAIRVYNTIYQKNIKVEKILTELPTKYAAHYLTPIKKLPKENKAVLNLITTTPLNDLSESDEVFWEKLCGLHIDQILLNNFPLRKEFKKIINGEINPNPSLLIKFKSEEEKNLLLECLKIGSHPYLFDELGLRVSFQEKGRYLTLMLGSQAVQQASLDYVKELIEFVKTQNEETHFVFFVCCSDKKSDRVPLQKRVASLIKETFEYPKHLSIIPMSSQEDDVIAPLLCKSDMTITKAGGITSMELLSVAEGRCFIHTEEVKKTYFQHLYDKIFPKKEDEISLFKGMPTWESGNALYLSRKKGALPISPRDFKMQCEKLFNPIDKSLDQQELQQSLSNS